MATILRGKNKGKEVELCQWCNDWFIIDDGKVMRPTSLKLTTEEIMKVLSHNNNGIMFNLFELKDDGTFRKRKRSLK